MSSSFFGKKRNITGERGERQVVYCVLFFLCTIKLDGHFLCLTDMCDTSKSLDRTYTYYIYLQKNNKFESENSKLFSPNISIYTIIFTKVYTQHWGPHANDDGSWDRTAQGPTALKPDPEASHPNQSPYPNREAAYD